jgi:transcriptional regulator with XRE-family HTH domain
MSKFRSWRSARQLSQGEVAAMLGISVASICRIETGQQWPTFELMHDIEQLTKRQVTAGDILKTCIEAKLAATV